MNGLSLRGERPVYRVYGIDAGALPLSYPDEATYTRKIAGGLVLALAGSRLNDTDARLLRTFLAQLRLDRERAMLERL